MKKTYSTLGADWGAVAALFAEVGWGERHPDEIRSAFEKSGHVIFMEEDGQLVGFGRTVDDGRYCAMLADVVVKPSHQLRGLGREIVNHLREQLEGYKWITLVAAVEKDEFYLKLGWQRQKSAMFWPTSDQQRLAHALASPAA